jgi:hypothetical protein
MEFPEVSNQIIPLHSSQIPSHRPISSHRPTIRTQIHSSPKYGCLKNGSLPTYRNWVNTTRRNNTPTTSNTIQMNNALLNSSYSAPTIFPPSQEQNIMKNNTVSEIKKDLSEKRQKFEKGSLIKNPKSKLKYFKRRKIYKRTFKVGRSKISPTISVLVSNRTIRNKISTEAQLLKQTPIQDVKKYLIKKGFIKVGTIAPNDVLRKMYETVHMICGEIDNHNPENLLFNFMNDSDK